MSALAIFGLSLLVLAFAVSTGWRLLFHLAWLLLLVDVFAYAWSRLAFRGLGVLRDASQNRVQVGEALKERLGLRNQSVLPKLWLEVHDGGTLPGRSAGNVVSLGARSEKRWRRRTVCEQRGRYLLGPLTITASDPFGLFSRSVEAGASRELLVYPQVVPLPRFTLPALEMPGGNIAQKRAYHSTPTVSTVRDYVPGDSLSSVSWKATARQSKLMVKEFELDPVADVWIVLDLQRRLHALRATGDRAVPPDGDRLYLNSSLEYAVTTAASVSASMLEKGRTVGLIAWSDERQLIVPDRGSRQLWRILELLAVAEATNTPPLQEVLVAHQGYFTGNHSLLVITPDTSGAWRAGLNVASGRSLPVTAIYVDAPSFDPRMPRLLPTLDERRGRFYTRTLRNGDNIAEVLNSGWGGPRAAEAIPVEVSR